MNVDRVAGCALLRNNRGMFSPLRIGHHLRTCPIVLANIVTVLALASITSTADATSTTRDAIDTRLEQALTKAGANRGELERFLRRYEDCGDPQKRDAARWLIANMDGHGFARIELCGQDGQELGFSALNFATLTDAQARLDELERSHAGADFRRVAFASDLEHATEQFLSTHLEESFATWRTLPWAKSIRYEAFRDHILPYRGSNEPLELWRAPAAHRLAELVAALRQDGVTDVKIAGERVRSTVHPWVAFSDLYYVHPTDQGWAEMCAQRRGRCEDITNMISFGMRSVATMCASDYTPWWAASDNNHAWEVVLDERGQGRAGLAGKAAKVYRKTFAYQPCSLGAQLNTDEVVPRWLSGTHYIDVTSQYQATSNVRVSIEVAASDTQSHPTPQRFAYLAVFNGGSWRPIHWAKIEDGSALFTGMGREICYLPMLHVGSRHDGSGTSTPEGHDIPAGPPFVLDHDGVMHVLRAGADPIATLEATITKPDIQDPDTGALRAKTQVKPDASYELFMWKNNGWVTVGRIERRSVAAENERTDGRTWTALPSDGLFWLVEDGSRKLERIFTIESGRQVFW